MANTTDRHFTGMGRREFLSTMTRGAAATMATPLVLASATRTSAAEAAWPLRLSTSSIHFLHLPIEQACKRIADLGFQAVDIWSAYQKCPHLDDVAKRLGPDGLKNMLAANKLKLFAFSVYVGGYRLYADLLGKVGGGVAVRGSSKPCKPNELTARMRGFLESLKPDVELAAENNTRLAVENHGHALLDSLDSFKAFVDLNKSPHLGVAMAPYHLQLTNASVPEAITVAGKQLFFFYAWQHAPDTGQLPGHGPADFTPWVAALAKIRYAGYLNVFMHGDLKPDVMAKALAKSRDYLEKCYAKAVAS